MPTSGWGYGKNVLVFPSFSKNAKSRFQLAFGITQMLVKINHTYVCYQEMQKGNTLIIPHRSSLFNFWLGDEHCFEWIFNTFMQKICMNGTFSAQFSAQLLRKWYANKHPKYQWKFFFKDNRLLIASSIFVQPLQECQLQRRLEWCQVSCHS